MPVVPAQVNAAAKYELSATKLIIVEGKEDEVCLSHWIKMWDIAGIQILPVGGKNQIALVLKVLRNLAAFPQITRILIVRDADASPEDAFKSVRNHLLANGFSCPGRSWEWGDPAETNPTVCVAIIPAADERGALEELVLQTVEDDVMLGKTRNFIDDAYKTRRDGYDPDKDDSLKPPSEEHRGKAVAQAYMVTRIGDLRELGRAAQKGIWNSNHTALQPLRDLITRM